MRKRFSSNKNYQLLTDSDSDIFNNYTSESQIENDFNQPTEIVANRMNNPYGFDNTRWFRIENVLDQSVIELVGNSLVTRPRDPTKEEFQTFQCNLKESGHYEIRSQHQADPNVTMVWDYLSKKQLLIRKQNRAAKRSNQNWTSEVVPGAVSTYFIISAPQKTKCLKNMGNNLQVKVVPKEEVVGDRSAHWKLIMLEPIAH